VTFDELWRLNLAQENRPLSSDFTPSAVNGLCPELQRTPADRRRPHIPHTGWDQTVKSASHE
jgi:hypothetical protein